MDHQFKGFSLGPFTWNINDCDSIIIFDATNVVATEWVLHPLSASLRLNIDFYALLKKQLAEVDAPCEGALNEASFLLCRVLLFYSYQSVFLRIFSLF